MKPQKEKHHKKKGAQHMKPEKQQQREEKKEEMSTAHAGNAAGRLVSQARLRIGLGSRVRVSLALLAVSAAWSGIPNNLARPMRSHL